MTASTSADPTRPTISTIVTGDPPSTRAVADRVRLRSPVLVAAGDIADDGWAKFRTAAVAAGLDPARVVALGDLAYDNGTLADFRTNWQPSWGRFDGILWPVPGNHEYRTANASGYRTYLGITGPTWWSRRAGAWLVIGLDSQRADDATQLRFLRRRLAANDGRPTVIAWHRARYSSGMHGPDASVGALWAVASADRDVRIALWAHDHSYEHLAIPVGGRTSKVHAFVVGTGGAPLRGFTNAASPYTVTRIGDRHGVLRLRLGPARWRWAFVDVDGTRRDRGRREFATP